MSYFFNSNQTGFCQTNEVILKISNLTASYDAGNSGQELMTMISAPIIMFILIALFLSGTFDLRAVLSPRLRLLLSSALALFLPVMSYLFSEAKDAAGDGRSAASDDLSVRARVILTWMLLVELLRKKVDELRMWGSYSSSIERVGRVVWLGSLVYFNITSPGRKAVFSVLWILCAVKLLQRIVFTWIEKRCYPDKSWIISSYMAQIMPRMEEIDDAEMQQPGRVLSSGHDCLKRCRYIVMGEEKLVSRVTADGYDLNSYSTNNDYFESGIITVGKVWELGVVNISINRVCLSFALFKLLRRRFEHLPPMTAEEARNCRKILLSRDLRLRGDNADGDGEDVGALFSVMAEEVKFFSEYYHSVVPVVLAGPLFILVNYFLVPIAVLILCLIAVAVCGNGDMSHALSSMSADNYALQPGFAKLAICVLVRAPHSRPAFFFTLDLLATLILLIIFFFEEICEFLTVLISNWFIISMLCTYMTKSYRGVIRGTFRWIIWLRRKMSKYTDIRLKQFSLLSRRNIKSVPMTNDLKRSIGKCLAEYSSNAPLACGSQASRLLESFLSESVTELILTWHIATCLLENKYGGGRDHRGTMKEAAAAMSLSRYCAYLVVFHPELLPDRRAKAELVLKQAKEELRNLLGFCRYYLSSPQGRAKKLFNSIDPDRATGDDDPVRVFGQKNDPVRVVFRGTKLAWKICREENGVEGCWKLLADVWTVLLVYVSLTAAASDEELVKGHADILVDGVELITVLWAFAMHTGLQRQPLGSSSSRSDQQI